MKGRKLYQQNPKMKQNPKFNNNPYKINNKEISPHLNVLQFDMNANNNNFKNNFNNKNNNIRNLSQKPIRKQYNNKNNNIQNIQNNNYYFNNISNNFIIKNSYPLENNNININKNILYNNNIKPNKKNSQKQIKPLNISNNKKQIKNQSSRYDNNKNDKIKIKLDEKGVYISNEEDIYEDPKDPVNNLNSVLEYKQKNNLEISQEEKNMIETIKKVSSNRVKYRNTHQMLKEIGKIMKDPVVSFLIKKEPGLENKEEKPSDKLSEMLSQKLLEEQRQKIKEKKEEDLYYEQLQKKIKDEIRNKGSFDFAKLPDKDRQMLAQRKVYNKIGLKVYENYANDNKDNINNINNDKNNKEENIDEKIDNQIKNEINREKKKEEFLNELEKYNENNDEDDIDDYFKLGEINNNKKIKEYDNEEINYDDDINKEKPTARGILEKVLGQIEYKNEQLINHNQVKDAINNKKDNNRKKIIK